MTTPPPSGAAAGQDAWSEDDVQDEWSPLIAAAHPLKNGRHDLFVQAEEMIHNRRTKYALVELVHWLLSERAALTRTPSPSEAQPVAWALDNGGVFSSFTEIYEFAVEAGSRGAKVTPLYAHPAPSPSEGVREAVTGIEDAALLRAIAEDVPDMDLAVREQLRGLASRIGGETIATIRCKRCGHKEADIVVRAALASSTVEETLGGEG